ncbi:ABC-type multidrug transport system, ATPase component domain protein [Mycobacterium avium subsp. avium 2285 (R)]|nr:ABC-type multidrug transport system, ATPase component domain protein [Mycobacterium avium subsp. avium 2285 (R)]
MPPVNTRSTLPMVTTSPSDSAAAPTRTPLTKVPLLLLASRISAPVGVGVKKA